MDRAVGKRCGFTLIELLVVIAIIGLLAAILVPSVQGGFKAAAKRRAMSQMKDLEGAFRTYFTEYSQFSPGWDDKDGAWSDQNREVIDPLLAVGSEGGGTKNQGVNYKNLTFLELDSKSREAYDAAGVLTDPWGTAYEILLDLNFDDRISEGTGTQWSNEKEIRAKVGVQCAGPDKAWGTKDDIRTW